jgi:NAD(P)H dehydrogenase (quinone)
MRISIFFYSLYGHMYRMAEAAAEGAGQVQGAEVRLFRVPETLPSRLVEQLGAAGAQKAMAHVPVAKVEDMAEADGLLFGAPTRFGNMCGQMRAFLDGAGQLWATGALVGKPGGVMSSSNTQHGGQETTIVSAHYTLLHLGMVIVGLPYSFAGQTRIDEITGGSPYGASTIAGPRGERMPSENELEAARFQGGHLAQVAAKLSR